MRVAYLGPSGTYSQQAAVAEYGADHEAVLCKSLRDVVESVVTGRADSSLLPIENSTNGVVGGAADALLFCSDLARIAVTGVVPVAVRHQLFTRAKSLDTIQVVYSHPQVWGQAKQWLEANLPHAARIDCSSTAEAVVRALTAGGAPSTQAARARDAPEDGATGASTSETVAALGGPLTSESKPLVENCADNPRNTTRFLVLRRADDAALGAAHNGGAQTTGKVAGTVLVAAYHRSIDELIATFADTHTTVKFLAPRPAPDEDWRYAYLLELQGAGASAAIQKLDLKVLGHYQ